MVRGNRKEEQVISQGIKTTILHRDDYLVNPGSTMTQRRLLIVILLGAALQGSSQVRGGQEEPALRLMLSEVQPGSMSSQHYCMLIFDNRSFHAEKASRNVGKDWERK